MSAPGCGLAAPRFVPSCKIKNNSNGEVKVQILYSGPAREGNGTHEEIAYGNIPAGETFEAEKRLMDHGSWQSQKSIDSIEITRANGQKHKIAAPFDGVRSIEPDWLFVIDDSQISSVGKSN